MIKVLQGHTGTVNAVAIPTDGGKIVSGSNDTTVRVWSMETGEVSSGLCESQVCQVLKVLEGHTVYVVSVAISGDGARIVTGGSDNTVRIWKTEAGQVQT